MSEDGEKTEGEAGKGGNIPPKEHQFKPGNPGGPGRPKKGMLTRLLEKELKKIGPDKRSEAQKLIESVLKRAKAGNAALVKEIFERVEGKVPFDHFIGGPGGGPIQVKLYDFDPGKLPKPAA